jgi:hypothetical protein
MTWKLAAKPLVENVGKSVVVYCQSRWQSPSQYVGEGVLDDDEVGDETLTNRLA